MKGESNRHKIRIKEIQRERMEGEEREEVSMNKERWEGREREEEGGRHMEEREEVRMEEERGEEEREQKSTNENEGDS